MHRNRPRHLVSIALLIVTLVFCLNTQRPVAAAAANHGLFQTSNTPPTLDNRGAPVLKPVDPQDDDATLISEILASGYNGDPITDPDSGALEGIAIVGADSANGQWEYSINGSTFSPIPTLAAYQYLLLASDDVTSLRFVSKAGFNGTASITFRAWDRTQGTNGGTLTATSPGAGISPFSSATETATISVAPMNDAPVIGAISDITVVEDRSISFSFTASDEETPFDSLSIRITSSDQTLLPDANTLIDRTGGSPAVTITPAPGRYGSSPVLMTVLVSDGVMVSTRVFHLAVTMRPRHYAVPSGGASSGNCDTWATACTLPYALSSAVSGDAVWVKAGIYFPGSATTDSFALKTGVGIYGGFNGTETQRYQRDWKTNVTTLSGDINGDGTTSGNSDHVITAFNPAGSGVLDGFTITAGNANVSAMGGGIYILNASPTLINLNFSRNTARLGGAVYNQDSNATFVNVIFADNSASSLGGAVYNINSNASFINTVFLKNHAGTGSAVYSSNADAVFTNNTFVRNDARTVFSDRFLPTMYNSVAWDNSVFIPDDSLPMTVTYSIVQGGYWGTGNLSTDPQFVDANNNDFRLRTSSPGIDAGNNSYLPADQYDLDADGIVTEPLSLDRAGVARRSHLAETGSAAEPIVDIGAYETRNSAPSLDGSVTGNLTAIDEDAINNPGTLISAIIASGAGGDPITDPDPGASEGIAIIDTQRTLGSWQYTLDGSTWNDLGAPTPSAARLLAADATTRLRFVPNANVSGSATVRFAAWDMTSGSNGETAPLPVPSGASPFSTAAMLARITVNPVNDAPTLTDLGPDFTIDENTGTTRTFTIGDVDTSLASLTVTATSSNATLLPAANVVLSGSGSARTLTLTPATNQRGFATVTVIVNDGSGTATATTSDSFVLKVSIPPTLSNIADQVIPENKSSAAIPITVGQTYKAGELTLSATSSNTTLLPVSGMVFAGSGANRTLTLTPIANQYGTATLTVTVSDGLATASDTFVALVSDTPTLTDIPNQVIDLGVASTGTIAFTTGDTETPAASLVVTAASSNTTLLPAAGMVLGGSGANRTVTLNPAANQVGTSTVSITVTDEHGASVTKSFLFSVDPIRHYAAPGGLSSGVCESWANACSLPYALSLAKSGDTIWAKAGVYSPGTAITDTFNLKSGVKLYGGFAGTETALSQRNWKTNVSVLSGDVGSDGEKTNNNRHVVSVLNANSETLLDGFTIRDGYAAGPYDADNRGGGMTLNNSSPTLSNLIFTVNEGAVASAVHFTNFSNPRFFNVLVYGNPGASNYHVILGTDSTATFVNVTIASNGSRAMTADRSIFYVTNSIIWGNPSGIYLAGGSATVTYSIVQGGFTGTGNLNLDPQFVDPASGDFRLKASSPALDAGDNATLSLDTDDRDGDGNTGEIFPYDLSRAARQINHPRADTGSGTAPLVDMGAYETANTAPVLNNNGSPALPAITANPLTNPGALITTILASGAGSDPITDPDPGAQDGIAITAADTANGYWEYSLDGTTWNAIGAVSPSSARLLPADATTRLRFVPVMSYSGSATVTFVAWDLSSGSSGGTSAVTPNGGSASFSTASETAAVTYAFTNTAPTIAAIADRAISENSANNAVPFTIGDAETPAGSLTLSGSSSNPALLPDANISFGGSGANRTVSLTPVPNQIGTVTINITVNDLSGGSNATATTSFTVLVDPVIHFATPDGVSSGMCESWANACSLTYAISYARSGDQIWVRSGLYKPGTTQFDSFVLKNGVAIYGGFIGTETSRSQRNWASNPTVLDGEIGTSSNVDNVIHVVTASGTNNSTVLDGFTIQNGYAYTYDGSQDRRNGGGLYSMSGSPTLRNLTFFQNASWYGGAVYLNSSNATFTNVVFSKNSSEYGSALNFYNSQPTLTNVVFSGNHSVGSVNSVILTEYSTVTLTNGTFYGNDGGQSIIKNTASTVTVSNSIFWGNSVTTSSGGTVSISYSILPGGSSTDHNLNLDPQFANVIGGDFRLKATSPAIDAGQSSALPRDTYDLDADGDTSEPVPYTLNAAPRLVDHPRSDTGAGSPTYLDIGAYEAVNNAPVLNNSGSPVLSAINEDLPGDSNNGALVSAIIASGAGGDPITDPDPGAQEGIAVIAADTTHGNWEYSLNGTTWNPLYPVSPTSARLLPNDATARVRFLPRPDYNGSASISFVAWDLTSGSLGGLATVSPNGGGTSYSTASETATITINAVNDPPFMNMAPIFIPDDSYKHMLLGDPGTWSDPVDGDGTTITYTYQWQRASDATGTGMTNIPDATNDRYFIQAADVGQYLFLFATASDDGVGIGTPARSSARSVGLLINNADPVTADDTLTINRNTSGDVSVLANDHDPDGDNLSIGSVRAAAHGTAVIVGDKIRYTPAADWTGSDSFTYLASDELGGVEVGTVYVTVNVLANQAPAAKADSYETDQDTPLIQAAPGVLNNDSDPDGDTLTAAKVSDPAHGTLTLNTDGSFTYNPNAGYTGADSFTYISNDGKQDSNTATVSITIKHVNHAPVAQDQSVATNQDTPKAITLVATDEDNDPLTYSVASQPSHGKLAGSAPDLTYTPDASYSGPDSFTFKANDGTVDSNIASVSISVNHVNHSPVAVNDSYTTDENTPLTQAAPGVLSNDSDPDSDSLTAVSVRSPSNGTLTLNADGSFTYTPDDAWHGTDSFTYKAYDGSAYSNEVTVTITITGVNHAPVALPDSYRTSINTPLTMNEPNVLSNDDDADNGDELTAEKVSDPTHGTLEFNADGSFTYTPETDWQGMDEFTYKAFDSLAYSNVTTVTLTVTSLTNQPPTAKADRYQTDQDTPLTVDAPGVLVNDSDPDGDDLTAIKAGDPSHGSLALKADGSFLYTPNSGWHGADSFTYKACDGSLCSDEVTVSLTVLETNHAPVLAAIGNRSALVGRTLTFTVSATDADHDGLIYSLESETPTSATIDANTGVFTWTPTTVGEYTFTIRVSDGKLPAGEDSEIITITVHNLFTIYLPLVLR